MDNIVIFSQFFIMRLSIRFFFSSFYFKPTSVIAYHLPRFQRISKILWTTYRNTHTIGGPTLTCNKQSALRRQYNAENGSKVEFEKVLLVDNNGTVTVGTPTVEGAKVVVEIVSQAKGDKVLVFHKKRRKGYRKLNGHRQQFSEIGRAHV